MIVASAELDAEVLGTSVRDTLVATAWRDGVVVAADLDVQSFSLAWDVTTDQVHQGRATLVIADPDGLLSPWGMADPLGPGGSRITLTWVSGSSAARVARGRWRIRAAKPSERWRVYTTTSQTWITDTYIDTYTDAYGTTPVPGAVSASRLRVAGGGEVSLTLEEDPTCSASMCRIDGDAPAAGASALTELRRLLVEYGAVDTSLSPADVTIPASYIAFPESRVDAVSDLLDMLGARCRVGGDGALQIIPATGVGPVWTIQGGEDGALVGIDRNLNDTGVYNACTSKGTAADGATPLVGRAVVMTGPLAYGGPFGKVPQFHQAIAADQGGVTLDAQTTLDRVSASGTVDLAVVCLAHPALQVHDLVTVIAPTLASDAALVGRVVTIGWSSAGSGGTVPGKKMTLTVRVTTADLERVADQVRHG